MDIAVIIAISSGAIALANTVVTYKNNKASTRKLTAEAVNIEYKTAIDLVHELRTELEKYKEKLKELKEEVDSLKSKEGAFITERNELQSKIQKLIEENKTLHEEIKLNKSNSSFKIKKLEKEVISLRQRLSVYEDKRTKQDKYED